MPLVIAGCGGGSGGASTGEPGTDAASGSGTGSASEGPTGEGPTSEPTSAATGEATLTATGEATLTATGEGSSTGPTGETDTGGAGLACPLAGGAGVQVLALTPELFADGGDPSGSESCAWVNPERGYYKYTNLRSLDGGALEGLAAEGVALIYGQVLLPEYRDKPLDAALLDGLDETFELVREHGFKVVPRFHYSNDGDEPDAELERILEHIEQLKPLLQAHADVIVTLQAGFIGAWGEWHSSQHGLDAPGPRKQILEALLAALPPERTVSVRRPSFKQEAFGGPLTADTAHDGGPLARLGHINDCFLASDDDAGTYQEPGEKDYAIADSAFVPVGGETCKVNPPRSECPSALAELELLHWNHLNLSYHEGVVDSWKQGGCYAEIGCRLGYRLAVRELQWAEQASPGGSLPVSLKIYNDGFAAPVNRRPVLLVIDGPARVEVPFEVDPRAWLASAEATLCVDAPLAADLPAGMYRLGLRLPDALLGEDPRQAIRLVNGEWDAADGTNWFAAMVAIQ